MSIPLLQKFINEVVDHTINELAKQPHEAEASGFALSIVKKSSFVYFVLYHPSGLQQICEEMAKQPEQLQFDSKLDAVLYMLDNPVVGYIRMENGECGWVLRNSAANKGYGPMMHDIALSYAGKAGVLPDRESHTEASRNVWNYYMTKRKNEIRTYPLSEDDPCAVYHAQEDEDAWFLDVRYVLRTPNTGMLSNLTQKGDQTFQAIQQTAPSIQPSEVLRRLGSFYFDQMYK